MLRYREQKRMCISSRWLCRSDCNVAKRLYCPNCEPRYRIVIKSLTRNLNTIGLLYLVRQNLFNQLVKLPHYCTSTSYPLRNVYCKLLLLLPPFFYSDMQFELVDLNKALHGNCFLRKMCLFVVKTESATCEYRNKIKLFLLWDFLQSSICIFSLWDVLFICTSHALAISWSGMSCFYLYFIIYFVFIFLSFPQKIVL